MTDEVPVMVFGSLYGLPGAPDGDAALRAEIAALRGRLERLTAVLRDVEWGGTLCYNGHERAICPACCCNEGEHDDDCPLHAALMEGGR